MIELESFRAADSIHLSPVGGVDLLLAMRSIVRCRSG